MARYMSTQPQRLGSATPPAYLTRGAIAGACLGTALAVLLLWAGNWGRGESMEGVVMLAYFIGMPLALVTEWIDWGHYASQWVAFVVLVVPANTILLGAGVGAIVRLVRAGHVQA